MDFDDYNKLSLTSNWNSWITDPLMHSPGVWSTTTSSARLTWDEWSTMLDPEIIKSIKDKDVDPEVKIYDNYSAEKLARECRVVCYNEKDLSKERILLNLSKIKGNLMLKCAPIHVERIECKMTPAVKENIIYSWRKLSMYGKKTPFIARFDEYGRRLSDEIKIETLRGMLIKIVDPKDYGDYYLEFKGIIPDSTTYEAEPKPKYTYKKDDSVFDEDLPF